MVVVGVCGWVCGGFGLMVGGGFGVIVCGFFGCGGCYRWKFVVYGEGVECVYFFVVVYLGDEIWEVVNEVFFVFYVFEYNVSLLVMLDSV